MRRFVQVFDTRQVPIKIHAKDKNLYNLATNVYNGEEFYNAFTILFEYFGMQFSVDRAVSSDASQYKSRRHKVDSERTAMDITTLTHPIPSVTVTNTNAHPKNSVSVSQVSNKVLFYILERFEDDCSKSSRASHKCWGVYSRV